MSKSNLPASLRKFLRRRKSEIRRRSASVEEAEKEIAALVEKIFREHAVSSSQSAI